MTASHFPAGCDREFMPYPAAKGNTGVPPVLASGHPDRCKSLGGGTPATRHSRDGHVPLHEKAVAPDGFVFSSMVIIGECMTWSNISTRTPSPPAFPLGQSYLQRGQPLRSTDWLPLYRKVSSVGL